MERDIEINTNTDRFGQDSSVGRAVDHHARGPRFNTHGLLTQPGWGFTQPSIPMWVGNMSTRKNRVGQH